MLMRTQSELRCFPEHLLHMDGFHHIWKTLSIWGAPCTVHLHAEGVGFLVSGRTNAAGWLWPLQRSEIICFTIIHFQRALNASSFWSPVQCWTTFKVFLLLIRRWQPQLVRAYSVCSHSKAASTAVQNPTFVVEGKKDQIFYLESVESSASGFNSDLGITYDFQMMVSFIDVFLGWFLDQPS